MVLETSGPPENVDHALRQTLNYRADATVVLSGSPPHSLIRTCLDNGQRLILINRDDQLSGPLNISLDNRGAARTAFRTLAEAGCRRLALVNSEAGTPSLTAREEAFAESARQEGLEPMVTRNGRTSYEAGVLGARRLFSAGDHRPDGAFCVTDLIACGFMDAARHEFGLAIPRDLSVIGFDDIEQAGWASYRLTSFSPDVTALAGRVVELVTMTGETEEGHHELIEVPLVVRDTVRKR
jgi:DNA-binding LacI/PurR family transcriptional regulator